MHRLQLLIGNKNYSSWSLRPWMLLRHLDLSFEESRIQLDTPEFARVVATWSPAGRVPVLRDGDTVIWDSLAICEYLAEISGRGWPTDPSMRALARSVSAEMHSGFQALRAALPMNARARGRRVAFDAAVASDIARIDALWRDCRARGGATGPWLFGAYSVADAMYAPIVLRFLTYGVRLSPPAAAYHEHAMRDAILDEWMRGAAEETWVIPAEERGV